MDFQEHLIHIFMIEADVTNLMFVRFIAFALIMLIRLIMAEICYEMLVVSLGLS